MHRNVSFLSWNCWKYVDNRRKRRGRDSLPLQSPAQRLPRMQTPSSNGKPRCGKLKCVLRQTSQAEDVLYKESLGLYGFRMWPPLEDVVVYGDKAFLRHLNSLLNGMLHVLIVMRCYSCWAVPGTRVRKLFLRLLCYGLKFMNHLGFLLGWASVTNRFQATSTEH